MDIRYTNRLFYKHPHKCSLPLAEYGAGRITRLEDLALVCANGHRMLHRGIRFLSVEGLRERQRAE